MAESLPSVLLQEMMSKVLSLAADEISLAWGFKDELKRLEERLEIVQALLSDAAENKKSHLKAVGTWLKNLKAAAYDADAVLDDFTYETLRRKVENRKRDKVRTLFSPSKNPLSFRLNMAHKIRSINELLDEIYKDGSKIGLVQLIGVRNTTVDHSEIRLTHPYLDDSEIVGREDDVLKIVDMLCFPNNEKHLSVIVIVGMGGQGKTTLAQLVCKNDKVVRDFEEIIWVCVSEDFDVTRILNEMVQNLTGKNSQLSNVDGIIKNELGGRLEGTRYLLVLDDVWNQDQDKWDCLRKALLGISASDGSKIMVTTRSDQVVSSMQTSLTHRLSRISPEDSWTLFKQRAFAEGGAVETNNLVDIGREIVKRCGGLPLAIKALGGLMYSKKSKTEWLSVQSSQLWDLEDKTGRVLPTLELSYEHLPSSLKHCFVFCSIFPKDFDLKKSNLIQIWMALGLLCPPMNSDLSMEYIGKQYFNTLFSNSLLQDAKTDEYNSITSCKMHDVVHDLVLKKSDNYCSTLEASQLSGDPDVVHLSLVSSLREIRKNSLRICQRLQTLILNGGLDGKLLASFKGLRVLVLHNYMITDLPDSIEKLKHLRYIDISKTTILSLPNSITKLYNLQTLRLWQLHEVPKNFGHLINLRHFCIDENFPSLSSMLIGIGRLTHLQTLPFFVVNQERGCHIKELGSLDNLSGDLTIFGLEHVENTEEAKHAALSKKSHLRTLRLCWTTPTQMEIRDLSLAAMQFRNVERSKSKVFYDEHVLEGLEPHSNLEVLTIENFAGGKFPSWMMVESEALPIFGNLVKIKLKSCNECEQIPPLGHLRHLRVVEIIGLYNVEVIGTEFYGKHAAGGGSSSSSGAVEVTMFPALRELTLHRMPKLEKWFEAVQQSGSVSVFPCLEKLMIEKCSSLITIPHHFPALRELNISYCDGFSYLPNNLTAIISNLSIHRCPNLSCLSNNLKALERLRLEGCNNLRDIPFLPSVREISILDCEELVGLPSLTKFFPLIEKLVIKSCPKLLQFPEMHCHTSLRELVIECCEKLTSVSQLRTLQEELDISHCPVMVSFPDFRSPKIEIGWDLRRRV